MANDGNFIDGLIVKEPHQNAPSFVVAKLSIKIDDMIEWLQGQEGDWVNGDIKISQNGKWYAAVDDWKPNQDGEREQRPAREQPRQQAGARQAPARTGGTRQAPRQAPASRPDPSRFDPDGVDDPDIPF